MGLYNSSTLWWAEDHKQQMVGGVPVDSPQSNQLVAQPKPLRTRWSYSGRARSSLQNGVVVQVTIDYKVFVAAGAGLEVRQGAILKNPNDDGGYFKVWSSTPIYSYGTRIDHWELEVQRDNMAAHYKDDFKLRWTWDELGNQNYSWDTWSSLSYEWQQISRI